MDLNDILNDDELLRKLISAASGDGSSVSTENFKQALQDHIASSKLEPMKPCPFCGAEAKLGGSDVDGYTVSCWGCGSRACTFLPKGGVAKESAIKAWNQRVAPPNIQTVNPYSQSRGWSYNSHRVQNASRIESDLRKRVGQLIGMVDLRNEHLCYKLDIEIQRLVGSLVKMVNSLDVMPSEPVAWMRRSITYRGVDGRKNGERIVSESKVYGDDIPLYSMENISDDC